MARAIRVGAAGGSAAYSTAVAATTASPYSGPTRGMLSSNHVGAVSHLPRAPPTAAANQGATPIPSAGSSSGSPAPPTAPQPHVSPAPQSVSTAKPLSGPAPSTLTTTTPAPRPAPATSVAALSGWRPPQFGRKAAPTNSDPLIVMIFGCRGSGKTTQAENIAERYHLLHLSSGDMYKEGKQPFAEVEQAVKDNFGPDAKDRSYNGLVLDRFVATGEMDAYYLQAALNVCQLPVPLVFWLQVDPKEGLRRAQSRGDQKAGSDHWRYVEQRAQAEIADRVYKKIGVLHVIDCNALEARRVGDRIYSIIDGLFPKRSRNIRLPPATPVAGYDKFQLLDDYSDFQQLTKEVHAAIGNTSGRTDSAPLSSIGGYVDAGSFANRQECKRMSSMYVTLKVDGQRYLVVKHSHFGVLGFPFAFTGCYDFNVLFDPLMFANAFEMVGDRQEEANGIEWMLDAEMSTSAGESSQPQPLLHIIDYVYFGGKQAKRTPFFERYELLREWFRLMVQNSGEAGAYAAVVLKHYVPINELPKLLPRFEDAPFAVDGIVFQGNTIYKFGLDKFLLKWKPLQLCTADFRLMNGEKTEDGVTVFDLYTTENEQEVPFPGAVGVFTEMQMRAYQLRNSVVVELELADVVERAGPNGQPATQWVFHRLRVDKPRPNKTSVVESIVKLKHLTYQELIDHCRVLRFSGPNASSP
ncbi:RNA_guanylyltransferase_-_putative [Leishmania infantum]|uniref:RNA_guanylyltransferase_-_putative n=3 Tax=Leishmania donovani species complex TaxID=38574 RepID=A0A6L0XNT1_LEIIN|nr:RNA_guanylyltransferase_-_putative [Leishmania infantum]SUZ44707.1 RNA_guanylyltransferase_-_putative [Leishmania infantum]VDZ47515.1 RNA_guanylyltransferase_putative/GeneDB:LmjF.32.1360 [Leishmania donovani]